MPQVQVARGKDGALMIMDGVTRATRIAKLLPGKLIAAEIIGDLPANCGQLPTVGEKLP